MLLVPAVLYTLVRRKGERTGPWGGARAADHVQTQLCRRTRCGLHVRDPASSCRVPGFVFGGLDGVEGTGDDADGGGGSVQVPS